MSMLTAFYLWAMALLGSGPPLCDADAAENPHAICVSPAPPPPSAKGTRHQGPLAISNGL